MRCIKLKASLTQRGVLRISSDRDEQFFYVGKFWQVFFGYSKLMFLFFVLHQLMLSGNFYGWEIRHGILGGLKFGPGMFWGFV